MTIDKSFIEKIESMKRPDKLEVGDRVFVLGGYTKIEAPEVESLDVHTLTGLVDFLKNDEKIEPIIHISNYDRVAVCSEVFGVEKQRETHIVAKAYELKHRFDAYLPAEDFIVYLQAMFVQDENTAAIMRIVGNITTGAEATHEDDGMTQRVTAKVGVVQRGEVNVPNPVTLRPFRTFADIEQPASKFVLRIKAGKDQNGPTCALFEADGGAWKNIAIATIREWLAGETEGKYKIIA